MTRSAFWMFAGAALLALSTTAPALAQKAPPTPPRPANFKNPTEDGVHRGDRHFQLTICEGATGVGAFTWKGAVPGLRTGKVVEAKDQQEIDGPRGGPAVRGAATAASAGGTAPDINVSGRKIGDSILRITIRSEDTGKDHVVWVSVHVIPCGTPKPEKAEGGRTVREETRRPAIEDIRRTSVTPPRPSGPPTSAPPVDRSTMSGH